MLSIIVPTRNRADLLQLALQSLQSQTLSSDLFEVLVIDNGSTDNTKQVVTSFQQHSGNIRYFFESTPGLHVGRHLGMKMAGSDILVYADDDIEAFPTWLEAIAESFQDSEVVLVGGKNLPKFESEPPEWILKMWEKDENGNRILGSLSIIDLGNEKKEISPYQVFGCNFSIRKSVLLEAGGFHPDAMPQELIKYRGDGETHVSRYIFAKRYKTIYHPKASVYHTVPSDRMTEEYFCRRAYNQGISNSYTLIRNKSKNRWYAFFKMRLRKAKLKLQDVFFNNKQIHFELSYINGHFFHQKEAKNSFAVSDWIFKDNYLD
jgi:glucosyl-dolichyl phosphate glucuronosyltransferase